MRTSQILLLGISLVLAAFVFGFFFYSARVTDNTVSVVGAATKRFDSDIVKWRTTVGRSTDLNNLTGGYTQLQSDVEFLKDLLLQKGIAEPEISIQPINTHYRYDRDGQTTGYEVQQELFVITANMAVIEELALNPVSLAEKGIVPRSSNLEYFYSKLSEIKMALLADATTDAQRRAEEIVRDTGVKVGKVTALRAGVFQITEPFSTEISDYGMYSTHTKAKEITVTVRATFQIE